MEETYHGKHSSLPWYGINYDCKQFMMQALSYKILDQNDYFTFLRQKKIAVDPLIPANGNNPQFAPPSNQPLLSIIKLFDDKIHSLAE